MKPTRRRRPGSKCHARAKLVITPVKIIDHHWVIMITEYNHHPLTLLTQTPDGSADGGRRSYHAREAR